MAPPSDTGETTDLARTISPKLSALVQELELERPRLVTLQALDEMVQTRAIATPTRIVAHRLRELGWLLDTAIQGVWEFAPAERAGAISSGDAFLTLRAALARENLPVAVALGSALWLYDLADRFPRPHELAAPHGAPVWQALRQQYRVVRYDPALEVRMVDELPVHHPVSVLVHLAERPTDVMSWAAVLDALPGLLTACPPEDIERELAGRRHATRVRFAYLLHPLAPDLVERLGIEPGGKVWFGPRAKLRRHDAQWNVADTVLPFSPQELAGRR